jgi:hypothetical protein
VTFAATIGRERDLIRNTRDHALAKRACGFHNPDAPVEQHETRPMEMSVDSYVPSTDSGLHGL